MRAIFFIFLVIFQYLISVQATEVPKTTVLKSASPVATTNGVRQKIAQLFSDYNQRFANGRYVSNRDQIKTFNLKQDALFAELQKSGNLKKVLFITNDSDESLTVNLYVLFDEGNTLVGLFYEKSQYYDEEERSYLRFSTLPIIAEGLKFIPVNGSHALIVKGHYFTAEKGGTLQFNFLKDLNSNTWGALNLFLINRGQGWRLYNTQYQLLSEAYVTTWTSLFPPNGGVKDIQIK